MIGSFNNFFLLCFIIDDEWVGPLLFPVDE
jgi:hypothetical protein